MYTPSPGKNPAGAHVSVRPYVCHIRGPCSFMLGTSISRGSRVFSDTDVVAGVGRLSALYIRVYVCMCVCNVCQHSKTKTTGHHQTWQVESTRQVVVIHFKFEVKRSNVKVGVSLHSSECQYSS